ncbi:hypothetical protein [Chryseobacterium binzhouense]|uniref:hypothetical protein n=1 Tax=Chryseobacterium binzhouense TaxID=2593646 RepID=UPI00117C6A72|nr:hypothetical protein [Chryseobacterium binzhouense]
MMKKVYLFLPVFMVQFVYAQDSQRYFSGTFYNEKKKPQNFLKVFNKNKGVYELTDEKGFAIIQADVSDTLVWNNGKNIQVVYNVYELKNILERQINRKYVESISSKDYDNLIKKPESDKFSVEKSYDSIRNYSDYSLSAVRKLKLKSDSTYKLKRQPEKFLVFNGSFSSSLDIKNRNRIPNTQNRYVQGRSENGFLVWKGPETGEMFSFGPDISTLGYNGQPYEYDVNGQLINLSNGISPAKAYNNNLFRTTVGYSNQLNVNAIIRSNGYSENARLSLNIVQQKDQMYFIDQFDIVNSFKAKFSTELLKFKINAGFNYEENKATNTNRIGLFNRVYQNSLLTPVSFSNQQNAFLSNGLQRSYSPTADNPEFLFKQDNKYNYYENVRQLNFDVSRQWRGFKLNISQAYDDQEIAHRDVYKISTTGFQNGLYNIRNQKNEFYNSNISANYDLQGGDLTNKFSLNHILNDRKINIGHSLDTNYFYQRTSQDYIFNYNLDFEDYNNIEFGVNLGNSFYISNTSIKNNYWLPKVNAYFTFKDVLGWNNLDIQFMGAHTQLSTEAEIAKSYSSYTTTQFSAQNAYQYFPIKEVQTFNNLLNINIKESKTGFKIILFNPRLSLIAEYFNRKIYDDVFPVFENQNLVLKNLADHTYDGYEVNFNYDNIIRSQSISLSSKASFFKYRDMVNRVKSGYNNLMISGFTDIYKTLTEGEVLGAVAGSYYERNTDGNVIIDNHGYPVKASGTKIIADPTPDFVMKFSHSLTYKMFALDVNWEWKKGGQIWNGTQAVLDYYGRSQTSADERNIKNYVFEGVNSNGNVNQIPVDFYNPNLSVNENRWTRYGFLGVAEYYVQKSDYIRINDIALSAYFDVGNLRRALGVSFYVNNIFIWQANTGVDSNQNFYDFDNSRGLDFFNLPSFKTYGCTVSFKF